MLIGLILPVRAADPLTFKEISLLLRSGQLPQFILGDAARRKLLNLLSPQEEAALISAGAKPALVEALRSPDLLAAPDVVAATKARLQAQALNSAKTAPVATLETTDAFSLSQLERAKAKAQAERKPLGFVMVWGQFFGKKASTRGRGSEAALAHFYHAFKDTLVLVFVRHENELNSVPEAVKKGFFGPDEGGFAPNMAVVDATASEFIVEIPMGGGNSDAPKRDEVFRTLSTKIDQWRAAHPTATASPK